MSGSSSSAWEPPRHREWSHIDAVREGNVRRREAEMRRRERERLEKEQEARKMLEECAAARRDRCRQGRLAEGVVRARERRLKALENDYKDRCREIKITARHQNWFLRETESVVKSAEQLRVEEEVQREVMRGYKEMRRRCIEGRAEGRRRQLEGLGSKARRRATSVESREEQRQHREVARVDSLRELVAVEKARRMDAFVTAMETGAIPRLLSRLPIADESVACL